MDFSYWPRLQIKSHTAKISIESATVKFTGFGGDQIDQNISAKLTAEGPKWVNNNQEFINAELTKVVVKYVNNVLNRRGNLLRLTFGMMTFDGSQDCGTF